MPLHCVVRWFFWLNSKVTERPSFGSAVMPELPPLQAMADFAHAVPTKFWCNRWLECENWLAVALRKSAKQLLLCFLIHDLHGSSFYACSNLVNVVFFPSGLKTLVLVSPKLKILQQIDISFLRCILFANSNSISYGIVMWYSLQVQTLFLHNHMLCIMYWPVFYISSIKAFGETSGF